MNALRVHVEKAVRPVRSSCERRLAMREELLQHLEGIYQEELARTGNEQAAVEAAIQRFGPADEISRNLQASVPWSSVAVWHFFQGIGDGSVAAATGWATRWIGIFLLVIALPWAACSVAVGRWEASEAAMLCVSGGIYGAAVIWAWIRFAAYGAGILGCEQSLGRTFSWAALSWLVSMTLPIVFWSGVWNGPHIREVWMGNDSKLAIVAGALSITLAINMILFRTRQVARQVAVENDNAAREQEWLRLEISE